MIGARMQMTVLAAAAAFALLAGCGSEGDGLGENPQISECGGFRATAGLRSLAAAATTSGTYCDAERLHWSFADGIVHFDNTRVMLNCCGIHSIEIYADGPGYVIRETDEPERNTRCSCMCAFDFSVDLPLPDSAAETVSIALSRDITDDDRSRETLWSGELNLADGGAVLVIDDQPSDFCE